MARKLVVEIIGDASSLEKSYGKAEKATSRFGKEIERAGRGATVATIGFRGLGRSVAFASGAFLGGAGFTAAVTSSINAASDMNEQIGKTQVVFGNSSDAVLAWSKTTADAFGESSRQALDAASSFGALLHPLGLTGKAAADQARQLTELGADLASFYNTDVQDALDAIRSGIVGEVEPLRRYGVLLSEARVQAEALAESHKRSARELTNTEKVTARINLIMRDSVQAQGDFARSSGRLAGQTKKLKAQLDDLQVEVGKGLLPAATGFVTFLNDVWIPGVKDAAGAISDWGGAVADAVHKSKHAFTVMGVDIGQFVGRAKHLLGLDAKGATTGGFLGEAIGLLTRGAVVELRQGLKQMEAEINKAQSSVAATSLGTDVTQRYPGFDFADLQARNRRRARAVLQRNRVFDDRILRMLDRVQDIPTLRGKIARLREISALIQQQIDVTKDITRKLTLGDQVAEINREILGDQAELADKAAQAAKRLKEKEEKAAKAEKAAVAASLKRATDRQAAINKAARAQIQSIAAFSNATKRAQQAAQRAAARREQENVFRLLGLTAAGDERAPSRGNLLAMLSKAQTAIGPTAPKGLQTRLTQLRHVLNTEFSKLTRDTKIKVGEFLDALAGKDKTGGPSTRFRTLDVSKITRGLDRADARIVQSRLSAAHIVVHNHVHLDGKTVARSVTSHQQARNQREPTQVRGRQTR